MSALKDLVSVESRIPTTSQHLYHNGQLLNDDSKTMEQLQIGDGEMLALHVREMGAPQRQQPQQQRVRQQPRQQQTGGQGYPDPETIRLQMLGNPQLRQSVVDQRPELGPVVDNPQRFAEVFRRLHEQEREEQRSRQQRIADLNADPFDVEAQTRIAEMIREERVQENLQNAIEHNPEGLPLSSGF